MTKKPIPARSVKTSMSKAKQPSVKTKHRSISVRGAKVHNLKNVSVSIPRNRITVVTGVSGSGKSSLAFDTVYAEGQRRFVESLSSYARQFLDRMDKPDVDSIVGIPPAIAIEQKTTSRNPRSTVGTNTEVYDYLRLLFGRIGTTKCESCQSPVRKDTPQSIVRDIQERTNEKNRLYILFPLRKRDDKTISEEIEHIRSQGFIRLFNAADGSVIKLGDGAIPGGVRVQDISILADRIVVKDTDDNRSRISEAIETALRYGEGYCSVFNVSKDEELKYSSNFECAYCDPPRQYIEPEPRLFSFNNPFGACPVCQGFGRTIDYDDELIFPDKFKTLRDKSSISPFSTAGQSIHHENLLRSAPSYDLPLDEPIHSLSDNHLNLVMNGMSGYIGIRPFFAMLEDASYKMSNRVLMSRYRAYTRCHACNGSRLNESARNVYVGDFTLPTIVNMTIEDAFEVVRNLDLSEFHGEVAGRILNEIVTRLELLNQIGLGYLTLDRLSHTLSGGEMQRINLASSIGSSLGGALYVLDEPSIGLHPRDTKRLIGILRKLRNIGNTVVVVEHDADIMHIADNIIDMGPHAGEHGGEIVAQGPLPSILKQGNTLTSEYLNGNKRVVTPQERKLGNGKKIIIREPRQNNLKGEDVEFPLGCFVVVTGVSGSGKSTLVHDILYKGVRKKRGEHSSSTNSSVGKFLDIDGSSNINHVEMVDQSPIGKSSRSTPATYTKAFDHIRDLFSKTPEARRLGCTPGFFSFNVANGGRCETCEGEGTVKVEMQFLADIYLTCEDCKGSRYGKEAHGITYKGKNIVDVLHMTVTEAIAFFEGNKRILQRLEPLQQVGLGYMRLGQPGHTLSGGEAQRVKLASFLQDSDHDETLFIFDEPTTGLHFDDIAHLVAAFRRLVDNGHSLVVIEHNIDMMKAADWIIDLGPEAGEKGGHIVVAGTPEHVATFEDSHTGRFLKEAL